MVNALRASGLPELATVVGPKTGLPDLEREIDQFLKRERDANRKKRELREFARRLGELATARERAARERSRTLPEPKPQPRLIRPIKRTPRPVRDRGRTDDPDEGRGRSRRFLERRYRRYNAAKWMQLKGAWNNGFKR